MPYANITGYPNELKSTKMRLRKILPFFLFLGPLPVPLFGQQRPPIIDMHMHTGLPHEVPAGTPALCRPEPCEGDGQATVDPTEQIGKASCRERVCQYV